MGKKGKMPLYYGDNRAHEFWESTNGRVLIFKNHFARPHRGNSCWLGHIEGRFVEEPTVKPKPGIIVAFHAKTVEAMLEKLRKYFGLDCVLDHSHRWEKPRNGKGNMVLLAAK